MAVGSIMPIKSRKMNIDPKTIIEFYLFYDISVTEPFIKLTLNAHICHFNTRWALCNIYLNASPVIHHIKDKYETTNVIISDSPLLWFNTVVDAKECDTVQFEIDIYIWLLCRQKIINYPQKYKIFFYLHFHFSSTIIP